MAALYRLCRLWHGYLSAMAFVWLLFFAITGILLNHPTWMAEAPLAPVQRPFQLSPTELAPIKTAKEPGPALADLMRDRLGLRGDVTNADKVGTQLFLRMRGARGSSDVQFDLQSGRGSASIENFSTATLFKELHRGEVTGAVWRALIDISGALLAATAILGLLIYFALRFRLRTALILIGVGLAAMVGGIFAFVS
jgi:hypothetical protein